MTEKKQSLVHGSFWFSISSIASSAVSFLAVPLLTRLLSAHDFASFNLFYTLITWGVSLLPLAVTAAIPRFFAENKLDLLKAYVGLSFVAVIILGLVLAGVSYLNPALTKRFDLHWDELLLLTIAICSFLSVQIARTYGLSLHQSFKAGLWLFVQQASFFAFLIVTFLIVKFILHDHHISANSIKIIFTLSTLFGGTNALLWLINKDYIGWPKTKESLIKIAAFGLPLLPYGFAILTLNTADRFILAALSSMEESAVYAVATRVSSIFSLILLIIMQPWRAHLGSVLAGTFPKYRFIKESIILFSGFAALGVILYLSSPLLLKFFAPPSYQSAIKAVPYLLLSIIFYAVHLVVSQLLIQKDKNISLALMTCTIAAASLSANFYYIPQFNMLSAAYVALGSQALLAVLSIGLLLFFKNDYKERI